MAAYAALVSVMHIIDTIEHHHSPPISIDKQQLESLTQILTSLQEFLEGYKSPVADEDEADPLEMRIADAAYAAEDVIESHIVDVIKLGRSMSPNEIFQPRRSKRIADAAHAAEDAIESQLRRSKKAKIDTAEADEQINFFSDYTDEADPLEMPIAENSREEEFFEGCDSFSDYTNEADPLEMPIAENSREEVNCIDFYQDLQQVIEEMNVIKKEAMEIAAEAQLQRKVSSTHAGSLKSSSTVKESMMVGFDDVQLQLLDWLTGGNRNRQIIPITGMGGIGKTTLARHIFEHARVKHHFDIRAWTTISQTYKVRETLREVLHQVSGDSRNDLSDENELGEKLHKYLWGRRYIIILDDIWNVEVWDKMGLFFPDNKMGYVHLPAYLKPCFLYMGMFEEDEEIRVAELKRLWVSEGFLKPIIGKSLETIATEYLKELVDRNLILVHEFGAVGNIKWCKMHDLVRDLCLKEGEKQRFYYVLGQHCPRGINSQRRIVIPRWTSDETVRDALQTMSRARSFICHADDIVPQLLDFRFLRTLTTRRYSDGYFDENVFQSVNLRYLSGTFRWSFQIPSSISLLWNLHTLIVSCRGQPTTAPVEIWKMHQLKHVEVLEFAGGGMYLPDPRSGHSDVVIENLETLKRVMDFNLNEEVVKRIPNIKKLYIICTDKVILERVKCLSYLQCLSKLESLTCFILPRYGSAEEYLQSIRFPYSLKKLRLDCGLFFHLEEILEKIGSLPLLEKLLLSHGQFARRSWEIVEGQFPSLKYLCLNECENMKCWTLEGSCLPRLEQLHLSFMKSLEEFPSEIGEIATLKSIEFMF